MKVLDLFSGIGGFSLGLERAGMETVAFCENDKFCQKVLAKHWPDVPIHNNIEELDGREYKGTVDLVCGGFPCQPFSVAGQQRGKEDDRALWPEMLRVIREVEPAWVIGENVSGIIHMELDNVLSDLEGAGYSCQSFVIPACGVDAKHKRDRVWILAHTIGKRRRGWHTGGEYAEHAFPPGPSASAEWKDILSQRPDLAPAVESKVRGMADGSSRTLDRTPLFRILGNGVVPTQAHYALQILTRRAECQQ